MERNQLERDVILKPLREGPPALDRASCGRVRVVIDLMICVQDQIIASVLTYECTCVQLTSGKYILFFWFHSFFSPPLDDLALPRHGRQSLDNDGNLRIRDFQGAVDAGDYVCSVKNMDEEVRATTQLVLVGEYVELSCPCRSSTKTYKAYTFRVAKKRCVKMWNFLFLTKDGLHEYREKRQFRMSL